MGCGWSEMVNFTAVTTELLAYDEPEETEIDREMIKTMKKNHFCCLITQGHYLTAGIL